LKDSLKYNYNYLSTRNKGKEKNEKAPDYVIYRSEEATQKSNVEAVAKEAAQEVESTAKAAVDEDIPEELF
jgi:hypothetical protein